MIRYCFSYLDCFAVVLVKVSESSGDAMGLTSTLPSLCLFSGKRLQEKWNVMEQ